MVGTDNKYDAVIVGAGFSGIIYASQTKKSMGLSLLAIVLEKADRSRWNLALEQIPWS